MFVYNVQQSKRPRWLQQCGAVSVDRLGRCGARCPSARCKLILCFAHQGHLDALGGGERDDDHNSKREERAIVTMFSTLRGENRKIPRYEQLARYELRNAARGFAVYDELNRGAALRTELVGGCSVWVPDFHRDRQRDSHRI